MKKVREDSAKHLELLGTVNLNDREKCGHKDDCLVRKAILEIEAEEKKNEEGEHQEDDSSKSKDNDEEGSEKDESLDEEKKEE